MTTLELLNAITVVADALPADDFVNRLRLSMVQEDITRRAAAEVVEAVEAVPVEDFGRLVSIECGCGRVYQASKLPATCCGKVLRERLPATLVPLRLVKPEGADRG